SPNATMIASGCRDNRVRMWDAGTGNSIAVLPGHDDWVESVAWAPNNSRVASASADHTGRVWSMTPLLSLVGHTNAVYSVAYSPTSLQIATGSADYTVRLWNPTTGAVERVFDEHTNPVMSVAYSPDGSRIASASADGTVRVWRV